MSGNILNLAYAKVINLVLVCSPVIFLYNLLFHQRTTTPISFTATLQAESVFPHSPPFSMSFFCRSVSLENTSSVWVWLFFCSVYRKPKNLSLVLSKALVDTVRVRINAIPFIFLEADVRSFEK